jgi:hypothetical protein
MTDNPHGLGWIESPPDPRDYQVDALYAASGIEAPLALPASYVVPQPWSPVLDQGNSPMCVAFSQSMLKAYEDLRDQGPFDFDEPTFFRRIGGGPNGAVIRNALAVLLADGYPVVGVDRAGAHKIAAYYAVPVTRADLCAAILAFGPVELGTPWFNSWFRPVAGVLPAPDTVVGGHAIVAIGWDARGLRLRNSWGTDWGLSGDAYLPWSQLDHLREAWKAVDVIEPQLYRVVIRRKTPLFDHKGGTQTGSVSRATYTTTRTASAPWWYRIVGPARSKKIGKWFPAEPWLKVEVIP